MRTKLVNKYDSLLYTKRITINSDNVLYMTKTRLLRIILELLSTRMLIQFELMFKVRFTKTVRSLNLRLWKSDNRNKTF